MAELLKVNEITSKLGISRATLYRLIKEGLPCSETVGGKSKLFDPDVVLQFLEDRKNELIHTLKIGNIYHNNEIAEIFKVSTQGGMRRSNSKNALVLFSSHDGIDSLYEDYWKDNILYYTGMGQTGDQSLDFAQNKTLAESETNNIVVYLFETFSDGEHRYRGIVKLAGVPFQEIEKDANNSSRKVWKFPLKLVNGNDYLPEDFVTKNIHDKEIETEKLDLDELVKRAKIASESPRNSNISVKATVYNRSPIIKRYSLIRANGKCELCENDAPFEYKGKPFLESHHVVPLSQGGSDTIDNVCGLCPNCHRKMHTLNDPNDIKKILENIEKDEKALLVTPRK